MGLMAKGGGLVACCRLGLTTSVVATCSEKQFLITQRSIPVTPYQTRRSSGASVLALWETCGASG